MNNSVAERRQFPSSMCWHFTAPANCVSKTGERRSKKIAGSTCVTGSVAAMSMASGQQFDIGVLGCTITQ